MFHEENSLSRRQFLTRAGLAAAALGLGSQMSLAASSVKNRFPIIAFSKPFQHLNPAQTAETVAEIGWNGIECPVRPKGQIEPEQAPDLLPKYAEAMRKLNLDIYILTTGIKSMRDPLAETVLRTASKLGIKRIRLGFWKYAKDKRPEDQLKEIAADLKEIAAACKELGLQAGFQNHSGKDYVGAPVWDVFSMIKDMDPKYMGMCFDIGHATTEGGLSWPIEARLIEPYYTAVYVKDFYWKKEGEKWKHTWCPLGQGMVDKAFFANLKKSKYHGPISQHHEYPVGEGKVMIANMQKDLKVLQQWLA